MIHPALGLGRLAGQHDGTHMQAPRSFDIEKFFERVQNSTTRVLMLDYDGTLAPFSNRMRDAMPYPGVVAALDAIMEARHTRVVIVSGRWAKDLIPSIGLKLRPELWGSHGWERVRVDAYDEARVPAGALALLTALNDWAPDIESLGGRIERKPAGLAFHWRGLPIDQVDAIRDALAARWKSIPTSPEIVWHDFDGGVELRAAGRNKGDVVREVAREAGHDAAIAYLGDDFTDEDAFEAIPQEGAAVLVRAEFRPTAAQIWIKPPDELIEFLLRWHRLAGDQVAEERRDAE